MKKIFVIAAAVVLGLSFCASAGNLYSGQLSNGLNYRIYKTNDLPIVSVDIKIKAGSYFDKNFGEADILSNCLDSCDTEHLTSDEFRDMADELGARISTSVSKEYIDINAKFTLEKADRMLCLLSEMFKSKFDKKNFDFVKKQASDKVKSLQNDNDYLAIHSAFVGLIKQPAYYHTSLGTINGIESVKRKDIIEFFKRYFNTDNMVISISGGKFNAKDMEKLLKTHFSFLKRGKRYSFAPVQFKSGVSIKDIIKPVKQSYIYTAFDGFKPKDKLYYASKVLSFILGGNLNSVLMKDIRTKHGYAYSAFSFNYDLQQGGIFVIGMQTQNIFTEDAVRRLFDDIKNIDKFITDDRIEDAKRYLIGRNEIALQSSLSIANSLSSSYMMNIKGLPWVHFKRKIDTVTKNEVIEAAKEIFKNPSIGIVSNKNYKNDIEKIVKNYGY